MKKEYKERMGILGKEKLIFGEEAFKRVRLGVVLQMTSIGIPMIWMGEEMGEYVRFILPPRKSMHNQISLFLDIKRKRSVSQKLIGH